MNTCGVCYRDSHGATAHGCPHCRGEGTPAAAEPVAPEPERPRLVMPERRVLVESLRSGVCPACCKRKGRRRTFCFRCYRRLSSSSQNALYRLMGLGYEQAVADALEELGVTHPHWAVTE